MTMMWWGGGGWWVLGAVVMVACMYFMGRMMMGHGGSEHGDHTRSDNPVATKGSVEILAERFARGEISQEEFEQGKKVLEGSGEHVHTKDLIP